MNEYTTKENKITLFKNVDENTEYKFYPIGFDEYKAVSYTHLTLPTNREV